MAKRMIGVMGPGEGARDQDCAAARDLGRRIAAEGWVLLTGGRDSGVMAAATRGARESGGTTVAVLPGQTRLGMSPDVDIPIVTGMGNARNNINVLSCDVVVACGIGAGTASEIALALKAGRPVVLLCPDAASRDFWTSIAPGKARFADTIDSAMGFVRESLREE